MNGADADERLDQARRFCSGVMTHYWSGVQRGYPSAWPLPEREGDFDDTDLSDQKARLARQLGKAAVRLGPAEAGFRIGGIYTALLPE